jgi:ATP-dependent DNA helicase DinG
VTRARTEAISAAGGDWFSEFSIPQAQIRLKQGFGRLIRTHTDRGIVCILDKRLMSKGYGKEFVKHLPPASRASLWPRVERFWKDPAPDPADAATS